jgi:hypothetical protein
MGKYANSPLHPRRHPLVVNELYRRTINSAYSEGTPIVAVDGVGGDNAIRTCTNYFIDLAQFADGRPPSPERILQNQEPFLVVTKSGGEGQMNEVLAAVREPFRIAKIPFGRLHDLSDNSFSGGFHPSSEPPNE